MWCIVVAFFVRGQKWLCVGIVLVGEEVEVSVLFVCVCFGRRLVL